MNNQNSKCSGKCKVCLGEPSCPACIEANKCLDPEYADPDCPKHGTQPQRELRMNTEPDAVIPEEWELEWQASTLWLKSTHGAHIRVVAGRAAQIIKSMFDAKSTTQEPECDHNWVDAQSKAAPEQEEDETRTTGHGHVYPRADGVRARCGGAGLCAECSRDYAAKYGLKP